jgi:hypothetical protein
MTWEHKPRRVPDLNRKDLETIVLLVREYGKQHVPIFSGRLMLKVEEGLEAYRREDALLDRARKNYDDKNGTS